ncbi:MULTISPECIES: hypothetical protein [Arthrospira]|uniref:Uncharacterized protein n=1 Tax=Limnospira platensis NIES-46 TaxID=1236695 RepID=A0A5M3T672_LIMPL|nr:MULTISPECIES: hypothetical protein [Arthrospira]AMW29400.1 hypothetical protein AP285_17070 [Arthrospira platensis YZ]KDR56736.1 hypothetical protein APPUASWS_014710 [Arthrospira platensis str. Paraca]MBD2671597.1 hypothetical protein [Arthrospira platensis FACHB-439]MBD2712526.1 hypothetical protein [Arthrospira platensis FACHB-835]MDF2213349.1 hypothetical protein [Arthrospira platensis NCB002]MDT9185104.1 hypothetical protein [Limnospira sp. PMC 289.06]MDT9297269.1 hypothetical protein
MIQLYRMLGLILLFGASSSTVSLLAVSHQSFRLPAFWLALIAASVLGAMGAIAYYHRDKSEEWWQWLVLAIAVAAVLIIGGAIQWM